MATMPTPVAELLDRALVAELTVIDAKGRPVTYPLIPLYDGQRLYMTSSTLFSRKLQHIDANARVAVSITDPKLGRSVTKAATPMSKAMINGRNQSAGRLEADRAPNPAEGIARPAADSATDRSSFVRRA